MEEEPKVNVGKWTIEEVVQWATDVVGEKHAEKLREQEIGGAALLRMTYQKFREYGIPGGPSTDLESAVEKLKSKSTEIDESHKYKKLKITPKKRLQQLDLGESFVEIIGMKIAGLSNKDDHILYLRNSARRLFDHLDKNPFVLVEGPPGCGKSSIAWMWACQMACTSTATLCWVHMDQMQKIYCELDNSEVSGPIPFAEYRDILKHCNQDILLVDGLTSADDISAAYNWLRERPTGKLILLSSLQLGIKEHYKKITQLSTFFLPSWKFQEYECAIQNTTFFHSVEHNLGNEESRTEKLLEKYYVAGGSVRWMFYLNVEEAYTSAEQHLDKAANIQLLNSGLEGIRSVNAVNHLIMIDENGNVFPVSEHVARKIAEKCETSFITSAYNSILAKTNPTVDGWIFEADFLMQLHFATRKSPPEICLFDFETNSEIAFKVRDCIPFKNISDIITYPLLDSVWLIPTRWNQGCYDVIQLLPNKGVRFLQVTRAKSHDLKLKHIVLALESLELSIPFSNIQTVEIGFVIPRDYDPKDFRISGVTGSLGKYIPKLISRNGSESFVYGLKKSR
eukprot:TRINITY_DN237_c0_g1_i1.p1 TRINITY_DN237_c0_g1~~TRINITY_DN237_c0_g1_i1.p1  ORF type:complete len:576 (+),score=89.48 TRINITY_DN237_c0_g1_i1:33-1730(+)